MHWLKRAIVISLAVTGALLISGCPLVPFDDPGCLVASCDDGNPCTEDSCNASTGDCEFSPVAAGLDCGDDGDVCNGSETCDGAGSCAQSEPIDVNDADPCTTDTCDPITGDVSHVPITPCGALGWQLLSSQAAPSARSRHSAVWTGSEMIVWGGKVSGSVPPVVGDGARYDPASDSWLPISNLGAPTPRHSHSAVWTGSHMIVWGGFGASDYEPGGGVYDPASDSWTALNESGAPAGRTLHATVWTGSEMIVWGGLRGVSALGDGARYDPSSDSWQSMSTSGAPGARLKTMAVWTGSQLIVWGGTNTFDWLGDGAYYDPVANGWTGAVATSGAPFLRESASGVWTGNAMLIWGGWDGGNFFDDGFLLDPATGWSSISGDNAPVNRSEHVSLWTGDNLFVWGGCAGAACGDILANGGRWTPGANGGSWAPLLTDPLLAGRVEHSAVWTGDEVIVWGGRGAAGQLGDGARARLDELSTR